MKWCLVLLLLLGLFGCAKKPTRHDSWAEWTSENGKIKVLSTTAMIDDLAKEIGGDKVDRMLLIRGEIDPHSYELVKGDDEKIAFAKIVLYNGLGLEHGASLRYQLEQHKGALAIGSEIQKMQPESILWAGGQIDPHIWMDISLWSKAIDPMVRAFSESSPEHAEYFRQNGEKLKKQMLAVHEEIVKKFQQVPASLRFLVTSHDAFKYFARAYLAEENERKTDAWKRRFAAPEGLAPDGQLSFADIQKIIAHLMQYEVCGVFPESNVSRDSLKKIVSACRELGHTVKISSAPLYGDAMGPPGSSADSYLKMIQHNSDVLIREWESHD